MKRIIPIALLSIMTICGSCSSKHDGYTLVWSDEFDGTSLNMDNWRLEEGYIANNELQDYQKQGNHYVSDGTLKIEAKLVNEDKVFGSYTSARMNTSGKHSFTYGRIEARMRLPLGVGTWPAFWMLGDSIKTGAGWPACGEIDIMEYIGYMPGVIHGTLHSGDFNHAIGTSRGGTTPIEDEGDWHIYTVEWSAEAIQIFVDEVMFFECVAPEEKSVGSWPFDEPHFILLNYAVGGWGWAEELGGVDNSIFPSVMEVDYVRVYQKE